MIRRQNRMKTSQIDAAMEMLRSKGRNGDTELAHVNPREKAILKALGGAGSRNPRTGLREYYEAGVDVGGGDQSPAAQGDLGLGTGPSFGNESGQGGGQIADLSQQDQEAIGRGGLIAGQNEVALSGLGAVVISLRGLDCSPLSGLGWPNLEGRPDLLTALTLLLIQPLREVASGKRLWVAQISPATVLEVATASLWPLVPFLSPRQRPATFAAERWLPRRKSRLSSAPA
jgi:hypothetical protein